MKSDRTRSSLQRGFTLIEVILAMTLLALMVTVLYGAFYVSHRATERAQAHVDESQKLRAIGEFLGVYLRSAYPYRISTRESAILFSGQEESLTFVSALSIGGGGRGMAKIHVSMTDGGAAGSLLMLEEEVPVRARAEEGPGGSTNNIVLGDAVTEFRLDYLDPQNEEEHWVEQWDGKEKRVLPRAVRMNFRQRGEEIQWIFPVMMSVLSP